ncbi:MAG: hypothetical protein RJA22_135 [Verrucomicrobiota bacterium]|jgi:hypothetical protein
MPSLKRLVAASLAWLATGCLPAAAAAPAYADVEALLARHCLDCHTAQDPEGKLVMESHATLMQGGQSGPAILPGRSADSLLLRAVEKGLDRGGTLKIMPPGRRPKLSPQEIAVLREWIEAGAPGPVPGAGTTQPHRKPAPRILPTVPPRRPVTALAYSPALDLLAVGRHGEIELLSPRDLSVLRTLKGHRGAVHALVFSADGRTLASGAGEPARAGEAKLWQASDGQLLRTLSGHGDALNAIALSPDGQTLATGSYDQRIKLWALADGREKLTLSAHHGAIVDLAFRPDGKVLASASADRTIKLWQVDTGKRLDTLNQPLKEQQALAWSRDGRRLAAAGADNRIRVWDVSEAAAETTNPLLLSKFAHEGSILRLVFSPDGASLLSSADDGTVKLWAWPSLNETLSFPAQPDVPAALAFLREGRSVAIGRLDGQVSLHDTAQGKPVPAPAPGLRKVSPVGLQRGIPSTLRAEGTNLGSLTHVLTSHPRLRATLAAPPETKAASLRIEPAADLPRGPYEVWVRGPGGDSGKVRVFVDDLAQVLESALPSPSRLPASFWGTLDSPADEDDFPFLAKAGQTLVGDLAVKSIGSKLANPWVRIVGPDGRVLAATKGFDGADQLLVWTVPASGRYVARVGDAMLGSSPDHAYRLSLGTLPMVTGVFPLAVPTNTQTRVTFAGVNLPADAGTTLRTGGPGEVEVPVDPGRFRASRPFKVVAAEGPHALEQEPNHDPRQARTLTVPGSVHGRLQIAGDADVFRFMARTDRPLILETEAARRGSPIDTRLEILHPDGQPVTRLLLQAVRNSAITFRGIDSSTPDCRVENWEEMELNEYLYLQGEVVRLFRAPQGPDSGFLFYTGAGGKRRTYFDTSATAHAVDEPCYTVQPHPPGARLVPTGLPVFPLPYANDDDGERQLGRDSRLQFTAPTNGFYLVRLTDTRGLGGDTHAYQLRVREARPDFRVTLNGLPTAVAPGSGQSFTATAERLDGFDGPIRVDLDGIPEGFRISTPLVIEAGHTEAKGTLHAATHAPKPGPLHAKVTATATIQGQAVTRDVAGFASLALAAKPKLLVSLAPAAEDAPAGPAASPIVLQPGARVPAWLRVQRQGHDGLVTFFVEGLPHGVIVDDIGLNGVLIPAGENERRIFLHCAKWVADQDRWGYAIEQQAGRQTSTPVLIQVRQRPALGTAKQP